MKDINKPIFVCCWTSFGFGDLQATHCLLNDSLRTRHPLHSHCPSIALNLAAKDDIATGLSFFALLTEHIGAFNRLSIVAEDLVF